MRTTKPAPMRVATDIWHVKGVKPVPQDDKGGFDNLEFHSER